MRAPTVFACALFLFACSGSPPGGPSADEGSQGVNENRGSGGAPEDASFPQSSDAPFDGGADARGSDAGTPADGSVLDAADAGGPGSTDAAALDAQVPDAAVPDGGAVDAAVPDAQVPDAALPDAESPDAGAADAEVPDGGAADAEVPDGGAADAEVPDGGAADAEVPDGGAPDAEPTVDAGPPVDQVTYLAGTSVATLAGSDQAGVQDGVGAAATFSNPVNVEILADGALAVTEWDASRVRKVTPAGVVSAFVAQPGFANPFGLAVAPDGTLFVQTDANSAEERETYLEGTIWRIAAGTSTPVVVAENIGRPRGMVVLPSGDLVLADPYHHTLRRMSPTGTLTPLAGAFDASGYADGRGAAARFDHPYGLALLPDGSIVVADAGNRNLRRVTTDGDVTTLVGAGVALHTRDGALSTAEFVSPRDVAVDASGRVYVADVGARRIRRVDLTASTVVTVAGDGTAGAADGAGSAASFFGMEGLAVTSDGATIYVADGTGGESEPYHRVRVVHLP